MLAGEEFLEKLTAHSIHRIAFIRHAKTLPAPDGIDFNRQLSEAGRSQARQAAASYGRFDLLPYFPLAMASPSHRTMDTAKLFLDENKTFGPKVEIRQIDIAYDETMQPEGSDLLNDFGHGPLRNYLESRDRLDRETSRQLLGKYACDIAEAIVQTISGEEKRSEDSKPSTLLFFGHEIYLPSVALKVASLAGIEEPMVECLLDTATYEAEGYLVDVNVKTCRYLSVED